MKCTVRSREEVQKQIKRWEREGDGLRFRGTLNSGIYLLLFLESVRIIIWVLRF